MQHSPLDVRLQQLIVGWRGDQRNEPLTALHAQCAEVAEHDNPLLPVRLYLVKHLDSATLRDALKRSSALVKYQRPPQGRFDAALVPIGSTHGPLDRFVLAVEQTLPLQDQVALYAHTVGHLLLNHQARLMERGLNLNPDSGMTHTDKLAELRYVEKIRSKADRDVLETFPTLAALIEPPEESMATVVAATQDVRMRLSTCGWKTASRLLESPYVFTAGRVLPGSTRRGRKRSVDVLLRASVSLPIAVLHSQRAGEAYEDAAQRVQDAAERLAVPFAYIVGLHGDVHEFDYKKEGAEPVYTLRSELPTHEELVDRWLVFLHLSADREVLLFPYWQGKQPRYYQDAAVNRALIAVLQARRGLRERRVLLTLATGTGKTLIAFQLLWKLKQTRTVNNVLFLADRSYLLGQAIIGDFAPLRDRIWLSEGESRTAYDILFASYQWLTKVQDGVSHYEDYAPDHFDVIVVDECHRGSANEDSLWHKVLTYFTEAVQVGLTATPLTTKDVQTSSYFGPSVFTYTLSRGINDGFLAPYRVRRILIGQQSNPDPDAEEQTSPSTLDDAAQFDPLRGTTATAELAEALVMEARYTMRQYTQTIATHLAHYLQQTDSRAKTIVFCVDNEHAAQLRDALQAASTSWGRAGDIVRIVDDDKRDGKLALSNFCSTTERQPVVVTTSKLLSTGIDAPTCKNIVLARAVGSMVEFKQIIGRGTRLFGQDKTWFTILDYAGAIKHFFDPSFDGNPEFIMNEPLLPQETENTTPTSQEEPAEPAQTDEPLTAEPTPTTARAEAATDEQQAQADSMETARAAAEKTPQTPLEYAYEIKEPDTSTYEIEEEADASRYTLIRPADQRVEAHEHHATDYEQDAILPAAPVVEAPTASLSVSGDGAHVQSGRTKPPVRVQPAKPHVVAERTDGTRIEVQGEIWFELGADGRRLRMQTIQEWAKLMLHNLVPTPQELSARWIEPLQRDEIVEILAEQIVALDVLAREMHLEDVDPFDVLLQAVFGTPALTRAERVTRLRQQQVTFFQHFEQNPLASRVVHAILDWYMHVPIGISAYEEQDMLDISDMQLLNVPSIAQPGEQMEIAQAFQHCGQPIRATLKELKRLLYHV